VKIVINDCYGGFGLSEVAMRRYCELMGIELVVETDPDYTEFQNFYVGSKHPDNLINEREFGRADPLLVQVVEELGEQCNTRTSELKIVEIPDDVEWEVAEYDGIEWVAEKHRTWR